MKSNELREFLEEKYQKYNTPDFISEDPVSVPHQFENKEDIEISGFLTALIAWGRRDIIIRNANRLMEIMGQEPFRFVAEASEEELAGLDNFVHRTFQGVDGKALVLGLRNIYKDRGGLEGVFTEALSPGFTQNESDLPSKEAKSPLNYPPEGTKNGLIALRSHFIHSPNFPQRTQKHLADPEKGSSAKRLNMYLRWMVRNDRAGVDFGLWKGISPAQLICPLDVHVGNVARKLKLLKRSQNDWKAAVDLTSNLAKFDPADPVKYDFALFGLGIYEGF